VKKDGTITARRGRLIAGKFEQYERNIPYFTITQALRELVGRAGPVESKP